MKRTRGASQDLAESKILARYTAPVPRSSERKGEGASNSNSLRFHLHGKENRTLHVQNPFRIFLFASGSKTISEQLRFLLLFFAKTDASLSAVKKDP